MNNEIKEILEYLRNKDNYIEEYDYDYKRISIKDVSILLDYITNLQQDLDKANDIIEKDRQFNAGRLLDIAKLKEENEFLKLNNPEMNIEHFRIVKENKRKIDNLRKENKILKENAEHNDKVVDKARWNEMLYKSRCEKAIEYIKTHYLMPNEPELENILNGSGKE